MYDNIKRHKTGMEIAVGIVVLSTFTPIISRCPTTENYALAGIVAGLTAAFLLLLHSEKR